MIIYDIHIIQIKGISLALYKTQGPALPFPVTSTSLHDLRGHSFGLTLGFGPVEWLLSSTGRIWRSLQASLFFLHRKLVKAELTLLYSDYIMHLKLTLVSVLPPAPSSQAQFTEAGRRPLGLFKRMGWNNTKHSSEPTVIHVSKESQIGM